MADMNAQIGTEELFQPIIGNQGFHQETNDNGKKTRTFCSF